MLVADLVTPALEPVANVGTKRAGGKEPDTPSKVAKLLPSQLEEQLPLDLGVSLIEYAKPKKPSNCMSCSGSIKNGEPRVGDRQPSAFFEGTQARCRFQLQRTMCHGCSRLDTCKNGF